MTKLNKAILVVVSAFILGGALWVNATWPPSAPRMALSSTSTVSAPPCSAAQLAKEVERLQNVLDKGIVCPACPSVKIPEFEVWPEGHARRTQSFCQKRCGDNNNCLVVCRMDYNICGIDHRSVPPSKGFLECLSKIHPVP